LRWRGLQGSWGRKNREEEGFFEKPILFGRKMAAKQDWLLLFRTKVFFWRGDVFFLALRGSSVPKRPALQEAYDETFEKCPFLF